MASIIPGYEYDIFISYRQKDNKYDGWVTEFVEQASKDQFGMKVKLPNSNVASRVLPVHIHELDPDDIKLCESVLKSHLRGIEFIYKEPGVNKPLTDDDDQKKNLNNTKYRIQINKTANSIKEIISGLLLLTTEQGREKEDLAYTPAGQDKEEDKKVSVDEKTGNEKRRFKRIIWTVSILGNVLFILILLNALKPGLISENDWIIIADFENHTGEITRNS